MKLLNKTDKDFVITVEGFSGPFDLLLHLIEDEKIDLYDISISSITGAYLEYLKKMEEYNLNIAAEFIFMASFLIELKSKMLIPNNMEDNDFPEDLEREKTDLLEKLVEYKMFKTLSEYLAEKKTDFSLKRSREYINREFSKDYIKEDTEIVVKDATILNLMKAFNRTLKRYEYKHQELSTEIIPQLFSIREKMEYITEKIFGSKSAISFDELLLADNKYEIVANFLAILELYKQGVLSISQSDVFDDIEIIPIVNKEIDFNDEEYKYQEIENE